LGTLADINGWNSGSGNGVSLSTRTLLGNMEGFCTGDSEGKMNFQGTGCRRFCSRVSLSVGVPLGNLGRGSIYREL